MKKKDENDINAMFACRRCGGVIYNTRREHLKNDRLCLTCRRELTEEGVNEKEETQEAFEGFTKSNRPAQPKSLKPV